MNTPEPPFSQGFRSIDFLEEKYDSAHRRSSLGYAVTAYSLIWLTAALEKVIGIAPRFFSGLALAGDGTDFGGQPLEISGIEEWVVRTVSPGEDLLLELIQNLGVGGLFGEIVELKGIPF